MLTNITMTAGAGGLMSIFTPLYWLFGRCMEFLLVLFNNQYFLALVVFTIVTRLLMLPLNIKQQGTMAKSARLQPKIQKIQKKYANSTKPEDRRRMNEETQELYSREGHNPMSMGCGPTMFQMVFLMGIIGIIYYPIQYIIDIKMTTEVTDAIAAAIGYEGRYLQMGLLQNFEVNKEILATQFGDLFTPEKLEQLDGYRQGLTIFGLDMTNTPTFLKWGGGLLLIPILCLVTSLATSLYSTLMQKKNNPAMAQQNSSMMMMMLMMPLFSAYISFQVPAAVGIYWIISNLVALLQQVFMAKYFPPRKSQARDMVKNTIIRRSREESIKKIK